MASDHDRPADAGTSDPTPDQEWQRQENVCAKQGKHRARIDDARIVKAIGTLGRSFAQVLKTLMQDARELRDEDQKRWDEERWLREEEIQRWEDRQDKDQKAYEQQCLLVDREKIARVQAEERQEWAEEKRQLDA